MHKGGEQIGVRPRRSVHGGGTMAGAVDLQFSSSMTLEIFKLDFQPEDREIPVVGESIISEWYNRLSWGKFSPGSEDFLLGLIDGGPVDGH
ncbi:hypothetical protein RHMOL_Rhmol02G0133300 [Rhododendron molle]|uniref:Uncharacterized protein n=1 Tax=Rhododendron molle TaxID=49168 RepID=A0ACC0PQZ2_RHOML|nr:hypothetical protein RHMOL_Rhmol02G0133300 [Rhododendron molle]